MKIKLIEIADSFVAQVSEEQRLQFQDKKSKGEKLPSSLVVTMEISHSYINDNYVYYSPDKMQGQADFVLNGRVLPTGAYSLLQPYPKPMLVDHNEWHSQSAIGRVIEAKFEPNTKAGMPGIVAKVRISGAEAIERVLDGRFYTVSVGLHSDAAFCSICGHDQTQGSCEHIRGQEYDGRTCFWTIGNIWYKEISYVNVPADKWAYNIDIATSGAMKDSEQHAQSPEAPRIIVVAMEDWAGAGKEEDELPKPEEKQETQISRELQEQLDTMQNRLNELEERNAELQKLIDAFSTAREEEDVEQEVSGSEGSEPTGQDSQGGLSEEAGPASQGDEEKATALADQELAQSLAERVVDLRIALGRTDAQDRDEALQRYGEKSAEYLADALVDLADDLTRFSMERPSRSASGLRPPGLAAGDEKNVQTVDGEGEAEKASAGSGELSALLYERHR